MNIKFLINTLIKINKQNKINGYKAIILKAIKDIKKNNNLNLLLIILLYSKCNSIIELLFEYNIDFNITKNGKNLLFYTTILRYHQITNFLLKLNVKIQHEFINIYVNNCLLPTVQFIKDIKYSYNEYFLLKLTKIGYNINDYKYLIQDDKMKIHYFKDFIKNFDETMNRNIKLYNLWIRRKNLAYIVHDKNKIRICNKYTDIFCNELIVDNIKNYL